MTRLNGATRINRNALIINDGICDMLVSYETVVCKILNDGTFIRTWEGYSRIWENLNVQKEEF